MRIEEVMVLWNSAEQAEKLPGRVRIAVVPHRADNRALNFLSRSVGACHAGWRTTSAEMLAAHLLAVYATATGRDGVPADAAHREFMKIDEYRDWVMEASGPFADVYWMWCSRKVA